MITNTGKEIIAKYLMGVAPAYASYIAVGCGAKPRPNINSLSSASSSTSIGITTVTVSNTAGLWVGAKISKVSGTGTLQNNTVVTSINTNSTQFTISPSPIVELSSAVLSIEIDPSEKTLDFEMFRVPISSRGYINDNGVNKIVFTAELPPEERYEISEIGLYSAGSNPTAGSYDSKTLYAFADAENWQFNNGATLSSPVSLTGPITDGSNNFILSAQAADAIQTLSNNTAFLNATRAARYERCRYFNNILMLKGNSSYISSNTGVFTVGSTPKLLQLTGQTIDFTRNSTADLVKIAFSIVNVFGDDGLSPDKVRVMVEFASSDTSVSGYQWARLNAEVSATSNAFTSNRYMVVSKRLDELTYSSTFSWSALSVVKIYVSAIDDYTITTKAYSSPYVTLTTSATHNLQAGDIVNIPSSMGTGYSGQFTVYDAPGSNTFRYVPTTTPGAGAGSLTVPFEASSSKYFIALDAIRLDNMGTINPLYGMTGYTIVQNSTSETIIKSPNSNNYIEFRVVVDVT